MRIALLIAALLTDALLVMIVFFSAAAGSSEIFVSKAFFAGLIKAMDVVLTAASILAIIWTSTERRFGFLVPFAVNLALYASALALLLARVGIPRSLLFAFDLYAILLFTAFLARHGAALLSKEGTKR
jgi:hypothetical protein